MSKFSEVKPLLMYVCAFSKETPMTAGRIITYKMEKVV